MLLAIEKISHTLAEVAKKGGKNQIDNMCLFSLVFFPHV
jgi:hypothetical protein